MAEVKKEAMLGNSHKQREEAAKAKKQSIPAKPPKKDNILEKEAHGIAGFLVQEVVVPSLKEMAYSIAEETGKAILKSIKTVIFGADGGPKRKNSSGHYVSYQQYYRDKQTERDSSTFYSDDEMRDRRYSAHKAGRFAYEKFRSRGEADMILDNLVETLERYGMATVSDFYEFAGRPEHSKWTDNDWGWTNLSNAEVRQSPNGWYVKLPEPRPLP